MGNDVKFFQGFWRHGDQVCGCFSKIGFGQVKRLVSTTACIFFFFLLLTAALVPWIHLPIKQGNLFPQMIFSSRSSIKKHHSRTEYPLNCSDSGLQQKCPNNYPLVFKPNKLSTETCLDYFRWIHHDLQTWKNSGITKDMIERGKSSAELRLVIVKGELYMEKSGHPFQTRDLFTIWGILQLLRFYPGKLPDLDLLFYTGDSTKIKKKDYQGPNARSPPPLFHYCGEEKALDIVFPDWTFWGWAEVSIMPWEQMLSAIKNGSKRTKWEDRVPNAYWKGNPNVSKQRKDLLKCNLSDKYDWNTHLYIQNWAKANEEGFKHSKLEDQCTHRYKIYVEGATWSVSEKYILACDSMTLMIKPRYYDFFSRNLVPMQHYWPIRSTSKCKDLKFAVEWGNNHIDKAQAIGKAGSKLIEEFLTMRNIYDYMFHLLNEYAKLLKFKPTIPLKAKRVCSKTIACSREGLWKEYMEQSMVKSPSDKLPCALPPPYEPQALQAFLNKKEKTIRQVEAWQAEYWNIGRN
ncbi:O-glucosyltransferase rumi homolog isoform X1 [Herrania umbratica]|uniref:O-glucosyltransferase rumi homolog isoform X1 n=1 Tax=Herrania umbratica TaxID=108875 RepID=A0A6J1A0C4_9ROSI|nr:O-glucosyltransferase rumi homolog isoform X1 [Herrania umbratica]XP_021280576.1 O-glucosyltransferase rumi homolog isoform X1 [Herrania umbratica]XP_021280577.1 O-glucosyltransferase rumi homolog isoform X1 [Herrania umbratica]